MVDRQHRPGGKTGRGALPDFNVNNNNKNNWIIRKDQSDNIFNHTIKEKKET